MYRIFRGLVITVFVLFAVIALVTAGVLFPAVGNTMTAVQDISTRLLCGLVFALIVLFVCNVIEKSMHEATSKSKLKAMEYEFWFYHRATDTWVPANGPHALRAWWSLDWSRWLTQDEIRAGLPTLPNYHTRLQVQDNRHRLPVWRDECEVWTYTPATTEWKATAFSSKDTSFMHV